MLDWEFSGSSQDLAGWGVVFCRKRDLLPAVGAMGSWRTGLGCVGSAGGVEEMHEIDDRNLSSVYGGEHL